MQPLDLLTLALAAYLFIDAMVNRALPFGIMTRIRAKLDTDWLRCWYCFAWTGGFAIFGLWLIAPILVYPLAIGGLATLMWRYTGGNHA